MKRTTDLTVQADGHRHFVRSQLPSLKIHFNRRIVVIFLIALLVRASLLIHILDYPKVTIQPDSRMYLSLAEGIRNHGTLCYAGEPERPAVYLMPGYPLFLAFVLWLFGGSLFAVVTIQIILDSLSCVLIYYLGESIWKGTGMIGGVLASLNMGMITYSHFILNDSLFVFIFLVLLIVIQRYLNEPTWKIGVFLGVGLGFAALIRPVIVYFPFFIAPFFFIYLIRKKNLSILSAGGSAGLLVVVFILSLSPWMIRNYIHYGRFKLTAQSGEHLLQYVVPFVWQYSKGIPFIEGMKKASKAFSEKSGEEGIDLERIGPFEKSDRQVKMAIEYLKEEPKGAIIKAWLFGMAKNLFSPAIIDFSYLLDIERPHFFYTEGKALFERGWNFIRNMRGFFGWAVVGSLVILIVTRFIQLWGFFLMLRKKKWEALFCFLIISYFLIISGPVGYAKYRLPIEPILIILMAIGIKSLILTTDTHRQRKSVGGWRRA